VGPQVGSVATYARCGGSFNIRLTTNLSSYFVVNFFLNRFRFNRILVMSLWLHFLGLPCIPKRGKLEAVSIHVTANVRQQQKSVNQPTVGRAVS